jgi:hypothetical protein
LGPRKVGMRGEKVTLRADDAWIIRAEKDQRESFMVSPLDWNPSPAPAAIFRTYEAGFDMMSCLASKRDAGAVLDVVPLHGAMLKAMGRSG